MFLFSRFEHDPVLKFHERQSLSHSLKEFKFSWSVAMSEATQPDELTNSTNANIICDCKSKCARKKGCGVCLPRHVNRLGRRVRRVVTAALKNAKTKISPQKIDQKDYQHHNLKPMSCSFLLRKFNYPRQRPNKMFWK